MGSLVVLAVACSGAQPVAAPPSNRAGAERREPISADLGVYVDDRRKLCAQGTRDHIEVSLDGRRIGTIVVICYGSMRVSAQAHQFALREAPHVPEGWHRIDAHHAESGRVTTRYVDFPGGRPREPREPWILLDKLPIMLDESSFAIGELRMF